LLKNSAIIIDAAASIFLRGSEEKRRSETPATKSIKILDILKEFENY
jgi:hypothetical protein